MTEKNSVMLNGTIIQISKSTIEGACNRRGINLRDIVDVTFCG